MEVFSENASDDTSSDDMDIDGFAQDDIEWDVLDCAAQDDVESDVLHGAINLSQESLGSLSLCFTHYFLLRQEDV